MTQPNEDTDAPIPCEGLTPQQAQQWGSIASYLTWCAPGFRHLFYRLLVDNNGEYNAVMTREVPVAATDAVNILINPDTFFKDYNIAQAAFILCHEIAHNMFGDVELLKRCSDSKAVPMNDGTTMPFDNTTMQHAMDYRINAVLVDSRLGRMPPDALYDTKLARAGDSVLDVYKRVYEKHPPGKRDGVGVRGGFDKLLPPGKSKGKAGQNYKRDPNQWQVEAAVARDLEQMRSKGDMPGALKHLFKMILEPTVPWTDHIRTIIARKLGSGGYNWRRPDRRFIVRDIHMPSRSGFGAGWVVCWGDTSGSVSNRELEQGMAELASIIEDVKPRRLTVVWCDCTIHHVDEIVDALDLEHVKSRGVGGRGGTSVFPVFDWIKDNGHSEVPDMFIGFTDGEVGYPKVEPTFPVIWADYSNEPKNYPWGEVVHVRTKVVQP